MDRKEVGESSSSSVVGHASMLQYTYKHFLSPTTGAGHGDVAGVLGYIPGEGEAEGLEALGQDSGTDDGRGGVFRRRHRAIGEVGGEVEEHGSGAEGYGVRVEVAGDEAVELLPQVRATVPSIIATVWHSAGLGGREGGVRREGGREGRREGGREGERRYSKEAIPAAW